MHRCHHKAPGGCFIPTFSFAAFFVSVSIQLTYFNPSSNACLISVTIFSAWSTGRQRDVNWSLADAILKEEPWNTYNGFAVLSKGGFDKHRAKSKAQGTVCVADAQLPAWSAALQKTQDALKKTMHPSLVVRCHLPCAVFFFRLPYFSCFRLVTTS